MNYCEFTDLAKIIKFISRLQNIIIHSLKKYDGFCSIDFNENVLSLDIKAGYNFNGKVRSVRYSVLFMDISNINIHVDDYVECVAVIILKFLKINEE